MEVADLKRRLAQYDNYAPPSQKRGLGWSDTKGKEDKKNANDEPTKTQGAKRPRWT